MSAANPIVRDVWLVFLSYRHLPAFAGRVRRRAGAAVFPAPRAMDVRPTDAQGGVVTVCPCGDESSCSFDALISDHVKDAVTTATAFMYCYIA